MSAMGERLVASAGSCVSRGVFLAGFSFFELTRIQRLPSGDLPGATSATAYLVLIVVAFALSSVSAGIGIHVRYYCQGVPSGRVADFSRRTSWLVHAVAVPFMSIALLAFSLALAFVGSAFFPFDDHANLATASVMGFFSIGSVAACVWMAFAMGGADTSRARHAAGDSGQSRRFELQSTARMRQACALGDRATFLVGFAQVLRLRVVVKAL